MCKWVHNDGHLSQKTSHFLEWAWLRFLLALKYPWASVQDQWGDEFANFCVYLQPAGASPESFLFERELSLPFRSVLGCLFINPTLLYGVPASFEPPGSVLSPGTWLQWTSHPTKRKKERKQEHLERHSLEEQSWDLNPRAPLCSLHGMVSCLGCRAHQKANVQSWDKLGE